MPIDATMGGAGIQSIWGWNLQLRRGLNDWEVSQLVNIWDVVKRIEMEDTLQWEPDKHGQFSVSSLCS